MASSIDEVLEQIGTMGRFQIRLMALLSFLRFKGGLQVFLMAFITAEPAWQCVANSSVCNITGVFHPGQKNYEYRCDKKIPRNEWQFEDSYTSTVTEWDLVCDRSILASVATSVIFAGWLFSSIIFGWLSDKFGRRMVLYFGAAVGAIGSVASAFFPNYWLFVGSRLFVGLFEGGTDLLAFILMMEFTGVRYRHKAGASLFYFWSISPMVLALLAYLIRGWRILTVAASAPGLICLSYWFFLPESARWLLVSGRVKDAETVLKNIARVNKKDISLEAFELLTNSPQEPAQKVADFRDLFRTKVMVHRTTVCWFTWAVITMVYYGVSLSAPVLGGNIYLNVFLTGIIEFPGNFCTIYSTKRFGRRKTAAIPLILAALFAGATVLLTTGTNSQGFLVGRIITAVLAKFFITVSFNAIYVFSAELFPTVIRSIGMGTSSAVGMIGSFCSSYIIWLTRIHPLIPYGIMGVAAFIAGLLCLSLPETKDEPTAETIGSTVLDGISDSKGHVTEDDGLATSVL